LKYCQGFEASRLKLLSPNVVFPASPKRDKISKKGYLKNNEQRLTKINLNKGPLSESSETKKILNMERREID
jgi:hypothetical protein